MALTDAQSVMLDALHQRRSQLVATLAALQSTSPDQVQSAMADVQNQIAQLDPTDGGTAPDSRGIRSITEFGLTPSTTTDHTQGLLSAMAEATAEGFALQFPARAQFNIEAQAHGLGCSLYGDQTVIAFQQPGGRATNWSYGAVDGITIKGFIFRTVNSPAWPALSTLPVVEGDAGIIFTGTTNLRLEDCRFDRTYGACIIVRNVVHGSLSRLEARDVYKDSFHVTGTSKHITRQNCVVKGGGDDAFPIVGYASGTGAGQPEDILDLYNRVYGVKYARAIAIVGVKNYKQFGCHVDGANADYGILGTARALYIASESSYNTYGNEGILVRGFTANKCGVGQAGGIELIGRTGAVTRNIDIEARMDSGAQRSFFAHGAPIEDVRVRLASSNYDNGAAIGGSDSNAVVEIGDVRNLDIEAVCREANGGHIFVRNTCSGRLRYVARSTNVCKTIGTTINAFGTGSPLVGTAEVTIDAQSAGNSGVMVGVPAGVDYTQLNPP